MLCPQHNTMESLLQRGEKLDDLVAKSEHLSSHSRVFYKNVSADASWHPSPYPTRVCLGRLFWVAMLLQLRNLPWFAERRRLVAPRLQDCVTSFAPTGRSEVNSPTDQLSVCPAGSQTELVLWSHVMPPPLVDTPLSPRLFLWLPIERMASVQWAGLSISERGGRLRRCLPAVADDWTRFWSEEELTCLNWF